MLYDHQDIFIITYCYECVRYIIIFIFLLRIRICYQHNIILLITSVFIFYVKKKCYFANTITTDKRQILCNFFNIIIL